jgi:hypothetical protein
MTNDWQQQAQELVKRGRQMTAGMVSGGEILIDADPENGFFRVRVRNVQPAGLTPQLVKGFCYILANGATMLNLTVKQRMTEPGEGKNE